MAEDGLNPFQAAPLKEQKRIIAEVFHGKLKFLADGSYFTLTM
jgi:hypothetical protein